MTERRVVVVGYDAAELLDIACITTSLEVANLHGARPAYHVRLASLGGRPVTCGAGLTLLATATLAARAGVSERHLTRLFLKHLGQAPGRFVRQARIEAAAHLLSSTTLPSVAARCGFGTVETLRQAFVTRYGIPPSRYRATQSSA